MRKIITTILCFTAFSICTNAHADCYEAASIYHAVNPTILRAISAGESNYNPRAYNKNSNGSIDIGLNQINSVHFKELAKYGIQPNDLWDPCTNTFVAAWRLRQKMNKYGNTWSAVGAYHSETPHLRDRYAARIKSFIARVAR